MLDGEHLESSANLYGKKWQEFKNSTYAALVETVKRFNAFPVTGLDEKSAINKKIQQHVSTRKRRSSTRQ